MNKKNPNIHDVLPSLYPKSLQSNDWFDEDFDDFDDEDFEDECELHPSEFDECPDCGGELVSSTINRGHVIIRTDICLDCGYISEKTEYQEDFDLDMQYEDRTGTDYD